MKVGFVTLLDRGKEGELRYYSTVRGWSCEEGNLYVPQRTSPSISLTPHFHLPPSSLSHNLAFRILLAMDSTSFWVPSLPMAASTSKPLPIVEISWPSTVTEADLTR